MKPKGLFISATTCDDKSAYSHRLAKLAQCLETFSIHSDFFFMSDHFPLHKEAPASLFMPLWIKTLRRCDFIHAGAEEVAQSLYFIHGLMKRPVILDVHGDLLAQSALANEVASSGRIKTPSFRVKTIHKMGMSCADHILTVCEPQTKAFVDSGIPVNKISLIRNGVDLDLFKPLPQPEKPEFTFGYFGEFQVWQGIYNLLEAMALLDGDHKTLLVGFRKEDSVVKDMFRSRIGPRVTLVDRTDRKSMMELIKSVAVLIIPRIQHRAIMHAFPTKFAEYAALGRPIMVNDVDETADFVRKNKCGFVSDPAPSAMARVMGEIATVPFEQLAQMGESSRRMAEQNFSWEKIGREYAAVVRKLTGKYHGRDFT